MTVDCDVIQADGGTRTASITGAYVALEGEPFAREQMNRLLNLTRGGITELFKIQKVM